MGQHFSFKQIQGELNKMGNTTCPVPCGQCRTAVPGDRCFTGVTWAMQYGIMLFPEWYPGLTSESHFEDFQALLHARNLERCASPCRSNEARTTEGGIVPFSSTTMPVGESPEPEAEMEEGD